MKVTFRSDAKIHSYSPGKIYTEDLNPLLEAMLRKGEQLILIDPIDLDAAIAAANAPKVSPPVIVKVEEKKPEPKPEPKKYVAPAPKAEDNEESDEDKE